MLKKTLLITLTLCIFLPSLHQPLIAEEKIITIDKVMTWWEKYGRYWEDADKSDDKQIASTDKKTKNN